MAAGVKCTVWTAMHYRNTSSCSVRPGAPLRDDRMPRTSRLPPLASHPPNPTLSSLPLTHCTGNDCQRVQHHGPWHCWRPRLARRSRPAPSPQGHVQVPAVPRGMLIGLRSRILAHPRGHKGYARPTSATRPLHLFQDDLYSIKFRQSEKAASAIRCALAAWFTRCNGGHPSSAR